MMVKETPVTVWHFLAENASGTAVYSPSVYRAITAGGAKTSEMVHNRVGCRTLRGFLFPEQEWEGGAASSGCDSANFDGTGLLTVGMDYAAMGDQTVYESPDSAAAAGIAVFLLTDVDRPPRISDGTLVDWVHFRATEEGCGRYA